MNFPKITAEEAAQLIKNKETLGVGGFGPAGTPKSVTPALAQKARKLHESNEEFKINLITGASVGASCDKELSDAKAVDRRYPFVVSKSMRESYNKGEIRFLDINLSDTPFYLRQGNLGKVDWALVEACAIEVHGDTTRIYPTAGIGATPSICRLAEKGIIVELNHWHTPDLMGMHDVYEIERPWQRKPIMICNPMDRIGVPYIEVKTDKIAGVIECELPDEARLMTDATAITETIGQNVADFVAYNIEHGFINGDRLILQSGVGSGANAVLGAMGKDKKIPNFYIYTEVFQDALLDLLNEGRIHTASTGALTICPDNLRKIYNNIQNYKEKILIRPCEISNCREVIARLGIVAMNTAIEADIYGHINSTKICGTKMMNGVGGSCDFTTSAALCIYTCASTTKDGKISSIVPFCSHVDHTEHFVDAIATEYGVADLRGLSMRERSEAIIAIAHPDYRPLLKEYTRLAEERGGHTPHIISAAFAMHDTFLRKGDMRLTDWSEYIK